ncbi:retrovirus-related pol polyprotein from transposon TNT 1-94 [Tanacetum coccineum]
MQNKVDRETRFNNEFDQFIAEPGEALVSVYNRFAQLMNDLERSDIIFPNVTVNTKFLNCLQPEWLKYVIQVRLAKRLTEDSYDDLFDYLQQFEKLLIAYRAKKVEKLHDPLALVAHMGSSSRTASPYYVTHPSSVVDYDDNYQGDAVQNNSDDPLTSAMILLARAITQCFSNPTNNRLRTSSNTRNQAIVQEEIIEGNNVHNDARKIQIILRTTSSGTAVNVQCYNFSEKGHYARNCPKPRVRDSKEFMEQMLLTKQDEAGVILTDEQNDFLFANFDSDEGPSYDSAFLREVQTSSTSYINPLFAKETQEQKYSKQPKIINNTIIDDQIESNIIFDEPNRDVNSGSVEYDNNVQELYALEQLARNAYKEAEKQQIISKKSSTTKHNLEQQRDKLDLSVVELKRQVVELQKTQTILKRRMSENEDKYHDTVIDLEARAKKNEDVVLKMGNSLQGIFMLGPKPMSFYDLKVKHGLGYTNPYTLKKAISQNPKLYDASCLDDSKIQMNVGDTEDILDDATKSQIKMKKKSQDPIAIEKKQNVWTIDYKKLNALYEDFVLQKEFSKEQKYFSSSFIFYEKIFKCKFIVFFL